mmetsp:Transcript_1809/g.6039  ORF Transcript_1809/g.6039 Transcript_1809/m.6039 type:complete len:291 (+) Transcript_1809:551-1423(+)
MQEPVIIAFEEALRGPKRRNTTHMPVFDAVPQHLRALVAVEAHGSLLVDAQGDLSGPVCRHGYHPTGVALPIAVVLVGRSGGDVEPHSHDGNAPAHGNLTPEVGRDTIDGHHVALQFPERLACIHAPEPKTAVARATDGAPDGGVPEDRCYAPPVALELHQDLAIIEVPEAQHVVLAAAQRTQRRPVRGQARHPAPMAAQLPQRLGAAEVPEPQAAVLTPAEGALGSQVQAHASHRAAMPFELPHRTAALQVPQPQGPAAAATQCCKAHALCLHQRDLHGAGATAVNDVA